MGSARTRKHALHFHAFSGWGTSQCPRTVFSLTSSHEPKLISGLQQQMATMMQQQQLQQQQQHQKQLRMMITFYANNVGTKMIPSPTFRKQQQQI